MVSPATASHTVPHRHEATARRPSRPETRRCQPWSVIRRRHQGLLRYARARGVVSLAVRYAAWGHRLLLRLPPYNDAGNFLDRADIALDVHAAPDVYAAPDVHGGAIGRMRIARVAGISLAVPTRSVPAEVDAALEPWPRHLPTTAVVIVPERITWLPVVDDMRYPPLPEWSDRLPGTFDR